MLRLVKFLLFKSSLFQSDIADIDMKLGAVTKLDKRNKTASKKFDDDIMLENFDVIVTFLIYVWFGAIQKLDSGHIVCKTYVLINSFLTKTENRSKKSLAQLSLLL